MDRHSRQKRLAEVGEHGQVRIRGATAEVWLEGGAGEVAARYLAGAGIGSLRVSDPRAGEAAKAVDPDVEVEVIPELKGGAPAQRELGLYPEAEELARGSLAALEVLRGLLFRGRPS
jgi:hypothetical protein